MSEVRCQVSISLYPLVRVSHTANQHNYSSHQHQTANTNQRIDQHLTQCFIGDRVRGNSFIVRLHIERRVVRVMADKSGKPVIDLLIAEVLLVADVP
jgi:hypothetical protein